MTANWLLQSRCLLLYYPRCRTSELTWQDVPSTNNNNSADGGTQEILMSPIETESQQLVSAVQQTLSQFGSRIEESPNDLKLASEIKEMRGLTKKMANEKIDKMYDELEKRANLPTQGSPKLLLKFRRILETIAYRIHSWFNYLQETIEDFFKWVERNIRELSSQEMNQTLQKLFTKFSNFFWGPRPHYSMV